MQEKFDDIRPYYASEIPEAMQRIAASEHFELLSKFIFPDREVAEVREMVRNLRNTDEFQAQVMYQFVHQCCVRSMTELTCDGIDRLDPAKNYLFISNHRDIMIDSSLLQYLLLGNGLRTSEITFGSNLMHLQLAIDIGKANKMFRVERSRSIHEFLRNSQHLSEYIRHTLTEKGESVWIAQRNGRTKDGNDLTDQGIIKMFCMSANCKDLIAAVDTLNIVPIAISYQIESCDLLKTRELYLTEQNDGKYAKQPGEDLNSILTGIHQPKGRVHLCICPPLQRDELLSDYNSRNEFYKHVATLIDKRIYKNYKLFDNNFIAYDILHETDACSSHYSREQKADFLVRCDNILQQIEGDRQHIRSIFLRIYAQPVENQLRIN